MNKGKSNKSTKVSKSPNVSKSRKAKSDKDQVYPDGYVRSSKSKTASEMLSATDIKQRMKNFEKVDKEDLSNLVDGDKVRYFEVSENGGYKYRPGGFVLVNGAPKYLVLTNNGFNWSVQLDSNIIFKAKDIDIIEEAHESELAELKKTIVQLRTYALKQKRIAEKLAKILKDSNS